MLRGSDVKEWRAAHQLSQHELADLLGVRPLTVSRWERGAVVPPAMLELALAELDRRLAGQEG